MRLPGFCLALFVSVTGWGAAEKTLEPNTVWSNDTTYFGDRKLYAFRPSDREPVDCPPTHVKGHHFPRRTAFYLKGLKNVTLDFRGATVLLHGKMQPFLLVDCTNVTVRNVSVRYDRTPYTQGVVRSCTDRELRVWIDPTNFPHRVENGRLAFTSEYWTDYASTNAPCFCQFFDGATRKGAAIATAFFAAHPFVDPAIPWAPHAIQFTPREENGELVLTSDRSLATWKGGMRPGNYMVVGHARRDHSNFEMADCRDVTVRNYRIVNGLGMGIFPFHCHNVTLDGVQMRYDETSPSIIANSADGIHAFACSGDFVVTNCVVEGTIDDALNVHGNYFTVERAEGNEIVAFTGLEPEGPTAIFRPGDRIAVHRGYTLDRTGEYVIAATRPVDEKHVAFTLDRPVVQHAKKDIIENLSAQCRLLITNCRFGKSNTHLRLQTRGGIVIENCESELPFCLTGDMNYWFESSPCDTLVVRNTRFIGPHGRIRSEPEFTRTPAHPHYHGDLLVENCTFDHETPIDANGAKSVTVRNCRTSAGKPVKVNRGSCAQVFVDTAGPLDEIRTRLAKGERKIALAKGGWTCDEGLVLRGLADVEFDFGGGMLRVSSGTCALSLSGCARVKVRNLNVEIGGANNSGGAPVPGAQGQTAAIRAEGCSACTFEHLSIRGGETACLDLVGEDLAVRNCTLRDSPGHGVRLVARRAEFVGNRLSGIRCAEVDVTTPADGKSAVVIRGNTLVGAGARWLRVNGAAFLDHPVAGVVAESNAR